MYIKSFLPLISASEENIRRSVDYITEFWETAEETLKNGNLWLSPMSGPFMVPSSEAVVIFFGFSSIVW